MGKDESIGCRIEWERDKDEMAKGPHGERLPSDSRHPRPSHLVLSHLMTISRETLLIQRYKWSLVDLSWKTRLS